MMAMATPCRSAYELRFGPLGPAGQVLAFECDAAGQIELDALSRPQLDRYLYARALVGRAYGRPAVCRSCTAAAAH